MSRIQQIFRDHAQEYLQRFGGFIPRMHRKAIKAICECRSGLRGYHLYRCPKCKRRHIANSSCGNRHCPVCQNDKAAQWIYRQQLRLLPCEYFLATFTLPEAMHKLSRSQQKVVYGALFEQASEALSTLEADPRFVGCKVSGFFAVLHTWGRQLQYHPHVHFVIPGGGLSDDRKQWVAARGHFLVHVRALSKLFRGKMRAALERAALLKLVPPEVWKKPWVVHCKSVGDGRRALKYLGAYLFRVAISEARVVSYDGQEVTFQYQRSVHADGASSLYRLSSSCAAFLQHVLPRGFVKLRHFGFLSPNFKVPLQKIPGTHLCPLRSACLHPRPGQTRPNNPNLCAAPAVACPCSGFASSLHAAHH